MRLALPEPVVEPEVEEPEVDATIVGVGAAGADTCCVACGGVSAPE